MTTNSNENKCPKCGSTNIAWGPFECEGDYGIFPAECEDCGFEGNQVVDFQFQCWQDADNNELESWKDTQL